MNEAWSTPIFNFLTKEWATDSPVEHKVESIIPGHAGRQNTRVDFHSPTHLDCWCKDLEIAVSNHLRATPADGKVNSPIGIHAVRDNPLPSPQETIVLENESREDASSRLKNLGTREPKLGKDSGGHRDIYIYD